MIPAWLVAVTILAYMGALFAVAHYGNTTGRGFVGARARSAIYVLGLGIYCTSWTFFGSVGLASHRGLEFLPIYLGPLIVFWLFSPLILRMVRLAKAQNITSIADFIAARYGKAGPVAAVVAVISAIGVLPYIALQLKSISASLTTVLGSTESDRFYSDASSGHLSALVAIGLAGFAVAFGTRRLDATEHQDGLMLAIATESVVKLISFIIVGAYVTWGMFDGLGDLARRVAENASLNAVIGTQPDLATWSVMTLLAGSAILLLPRQFHVTIVENRKEEDVRKAAWLFPLYIIVINLFVIPLAIAGLILFPEGSIDRDITVLALPLSAHASFIVLTTLIGGLSAATAMVIVGAVALSIMISNDLVMPLLLRIPRSRQAVERGDIGGLILIVRRVAIIAVVGLSYLYYLHASEAALASIGLLSFACIAQIAPAFLGGLVWRRATGRGAIAGLVTGVSVWAYTLLLPSLEPASLSINELVAPGPLGIELLRPTALFGAHMSPLVHGVVFSLGANILAFVVFSLTRRASQIERLQANIFLETKTMPMAQAFRLWRSSVTMGELEAAVTRYLGAERTRRSFERFLSARGMVLATDAEADIQLLRFAEYLIASAIGSASSRLVISLLLRRRSVSRDAALQLVDEVSAEIQQSRDLLQHAIDFAHQGITVFDKDLRLVCWNREFRDLFDLPSDMMRVGIGLDDIIRFNAERGLYGPGPSDEYLAARLETLVGGSAVLRLHLPSSGRVLEVRSARLPDGGLVTTYTDATAHVQSEQELEAENEKLERRVRERTDELVRLNEELAGAKAAAEEANLSKTRFLAAASHDLLQPLNAARLYATSLNERMSDGKSVPDTLSLAQNIDASLEAVEEILTALLDISRLDAGAMKPEIGAVRIDDIFRQLEVEFGPSAREQRIALTFSPCSLAVRSDRRLLRRLLQNLVSNAIKYTPNGRVLVGVRRKGARLRIEVHDTGIGIPAAKQRVVFQEFERLEAAVKTARGAGLGLSIVERLSRVLEHPITLVSEPDRGSVFSLEIPRDTGFAVAEAGVAHPPALHRPLAGMTVGAIDNDPQILAGMATLLEGWGCHVVGAADGAALAARLAEVHQRPDVVVADYHLDESDGLLAIDLLRESFGADLPAVLVTADRSVEVRERASLHDVRLLTKPLKPAALRALLSQWRVIETAAE